MNVSILSLWGLWDTIYQHCTRLQYVKKGENIFRIVLLHYDGEPLRTRSHAVIHSGDLIIKLHIHNYYFAKLCRGITNDAKAALLLRKHIVRSLPELAQLVAQHPRTSEIKGIVGTTLIDKGAEPLGFSICDVPERIFFRYKRWYLLLMRHFIHPERPKKTDAKKCKLKRVYMSRDELLSLYLRDQAKSLLQKTGERLHE